MRRPAALRAYTLLDRLFRLRDSRPTRPARTQLGLLPLEDRVVPAGRPLPSPVIAAASGALGDTVKLFDADTGTVLHTFTPFEAPIPGGVRVAVGDLTGDGYPDVVMGAGPGGGARVVVADGKTGATVLDLMAFEPSFRGGVNVAVGDVLGVGHNDVVVAADAGGGPRVEVFDGRTGQLVSSFFAFEPGFAGGVTLATGDFTGAGHADLVLGAGAGGAPRVRTLDLTTMQPVAGPLGDFYAFDPSFRGGVNVATGDVTGDGGPNLVAGAGVGGGPEVKVFDGVTGAPARDFMAFDPSTRGGVRVATAFVDNDASADVVTATGPGPDPRVRTYSGATGQLVAKPVGDFDPGIDTSPAGGVNIAAGNDPPPPGQVVYTGQSVDYHGAHVNLTVTLTSNGNFNWDYVVTNDDFWGGTHITFFHIGLTGSQQVYVSGATNNVNWQNPPDGLTSAIGWAEIPAIPPVSLDINPGGGTGEFSFTTSRRKIIPANIQPDDSEGFTFVGPGDPDTSNPPPPDVPPCPCSCQGQPPLVGVPSGASGSPPKDTSAEPVRYADGVASVSAEDLTSAGFGTPWGQDRSWSNDPRYAAGSDNGNGWVDTQQPHLVPSAAGLVLLENSTTALYYDGSGTPDANGNFPSYTPRFTDTGTLTYDSAHDQFVLADGTGDLLRFDGFGSGYLAAQQGTLASFTAPGGELTQVTSWVGSGQPAAGRPAEVQRSAAVGGATVTESYLYGYLPAGDPNAGLLASVTLRRQTNGGAWQTVRQVGYTYYQGGDPNGNPGDLKLATVSDASGAVIDQDYYRYYTSNASPGYAGGLKYAFNAEAYARVKAALGGTDAAVQAAADSAVAPYADNYFEYDSSHRVTKEVASGEGCSACSGGLGTFTYAYTASTNPGGMNSWAGKTVETLPDGNTNTVYTNAYAELMLVVYTDTTTNQQWPTYYRYDGNGRLVLTADPSAVTGYSESYADLVDFAGGSGSKLNQTGGLIQTYAYASATTATAGTAGDAAGFVQSTAIQQGQTGTPVPQEAWTYYRQTAGGATATPVATDTVYRNTNGTGAQTTSSAYAWYSGTTQPQQVTTTLPAVTAAENGPGTAATDATVYDTYGQPVWAKDEGGYLAYTAYDIATGAVVKSIQDVNTADTGDFANLPSGWATPTGGGLELITTDQVDTLGRATKETSPAGNVTYTVYNDPAHEVLTYPGWNAATNAPTGPTQVSRDDRANGYTETFTMSAAPHLTGGAPDGTEAVAGLQSLSRSYRNAAGQVVAQDDYFTLGGLAYTTGVMGAQNTNYYQTQYAYDADGRQNKVVSPAGTIYRTVYDGQGREVSDWVGTDDTPGSGYWSPTNNTAPSNMVDTTDYQYDNGGVGDGNLTRVTEHPGLTAPDRVTQTWYDWRDRAVAVKQGVAANPSSENDGTNRPLFVTTYDNLGEVTETQRYTADTYTPAIVSGAFSLGTVPAGNLRAQTVTGYDELGRVYRTQQYDVNPTTGAVSSAALTTNDYYDARGNLAAESAPGGLWTKTVYDGAGRAVTTYSTDGAGGTGYAAATSVSSDDVLTQTQTVYDADSNPIETITGDRFDDATGTGALGTPTSGVHARVSYQAMYYDAADRPVATVDVGTNGGTAWTRPASVPAPSATVLVTSTYYAANAVQAVALTPGTSGGTFTLTFGGQTTAPIAYNATPAAVQSAVQALSSVGSGNAIVVSGVGGGWQVWFVGTMNGAYEPQMTANGAGLTGSGPGVAVTTLSAGGDAGQAVGTRDPLLRLTATLPDALGRPNEVIQDVSSLTPTGGSDKTTAYTYGPAGMTSLTVVQPVGPGNWPNQTTAWVYGVSTATGSGINSNDIPAVTEYPDPTTGLPGSAAGQTDTITVTGVGQLARHFDRNGTVHVIAYDTVGRPTVDTVETFGTGVDTTVKIIATNYDGQGNPWAVTSITPSGTVANQVERLYNGLGQLTAEYQAATGGVTGSTPVVQYGYTELSAGNNSRPTTMTYPNTGLTGTQRETVTYNYSSGLNNSISRLSSVSDQTGTLESYSYLGLGTVVQRAHPQPGVNLTYISQTGSTGDAGDKYVGLDRFGRVVDQNWYSPSTGSSTDDFQYGYDAAGNVLWRDNLTNAAYGELYTYDGLNQISTFQRGMLNSTHDGLSGYFTRKQVWGYDGAGNVVAVATDGDVQTNTMNALNEVTGVTSVSGAVPPTYDAAGEMTQDQVGFEYAYDAWGRLTAIKGANGAVLEAFSYDGLGRRVTANITGGTSWVLTYSSAGQVLEEDTGGVATVRYVWSPVYVNAMILRDRSTSGPMSERLWVQQDANWDVTAVTTGTGAVAERFVYDPFGTVTFLTPGWGTESSSLYAWVYLFQGMRQEPGTQQYDSMTRWLNPNLDRWTTTDPLGFAGGDANIYRFLGTVLSAI